MIKIKTNLVIFVFIAGLSLAGNIAMLVSASFFKLATTTFEAVTNIPSVASKIHPKDALVKFKGKTVRVADAVNSTTKSIKGRAARSASRSVSSMAVEAIPYAGIAAIVGVTAWELKDLCQTTKDIEALNQALNPESTPTDSTTSVCAIEMPNRDELLKKAENSSEALTEKVKSFLSGIEGIGSSND